MIMPDVPTGYTRTSGYPKGSRSSGVDQMIDKMFIPQESFELDELQTIEDELYYENLTVSSASWEVNENQNLVYVTINYSEPNAAGLSTGVLGVPEYSLSDSGMEIPIDKRKQDGSLWFPNYQTRHNYILAAKKGVTSSPIWWEGAIGDVATDLTMSDADSQNYKWLSDAGELPDGWFILHDKTKNIETVLMPSPVVIETIPFKNYNQAVNNIVSSGIVKTPGKTFGKSGQWLVTSCDVFQDGRNWKVTTRYQLAEEWDSDYYKSS